MGTVGKASGDGMGLQQGLKKAEWRTVWGTAQIPPPIPRAEGLIPTVAGSADG